MNRTSRGVAAAAMFLMSVFAAGAEDEKDFVTLFNGKDLSGFREVQGKPGSFHVEDGVITGRRNRVKGGAYWLSTQDKYKDFELRLEYMLPQRGNSGIFIRVPSYKGRTSRAGMEIQLRDDGHKKGKPSADSSGAIYTVVAPSEYVSRPAGEWNEIQIRCQGDRIQVTLNGKKITDALMSEHERLKNRPRAGYIGLSAHTGIVKFRNVRIRALGKG